MDHEAHVGLVDAHAKGVGGDDGAQLPANEAVLDVFLCFCRNTAMEIAGLDPFFLEELGDLFGMTLRGAVDYGAARLTVRQVGFE